MDIAALLLAQLHLAHGGTVGEEELATKLSQHPLIQATITPVWVRETWQGLYEGEFNRERVEQLARRLNVEYVALLKDKIRKDEERFAVIVDELGQIQRGEWDARFEAEKGMPKETKETKGKAPAVVSEERDDVEMDDQTEDMEAGPLEKEATVANEEEDEMEVGKDNVVDAVVEEDEEVEEEGEDEEVEEEGEDEEVEEEGEDEEGEEEGEEEEKDIEELEGADEDGEHEQEEFVEEEEQADSKAEVKLEKDPISDVERRRFASQILPLLANISSHRFANLFAEPITDAIAPSYSVVVRHPTDLKTIKAKIKDGRIASMTAFTRELQLMITNAVMYNGDQSEIYDMALAFQEEIDTITTSLDGPRRRSLH